MKWNNKKPHHDGPVRRHDLKDLKVNHRVNESLVSCHFRYFLLSHFYCHRMILQPEEVPKMSESIQCPDRDREHND